MRAVAPDRAELDVECGRAELVLYDLADHERDVAALQHIDESCPARVVVILDDASDAQLAAARDAGADEFVLRDASSA